MFLVLLWFLMNRTWNHLESISKTRRFRRRSPAGNFAPLILPWPCRRQTSWLNIISILQHLFKFQNSNVMLIRLFWIIFLWHKVAAKIRPEDSFFSGGWEVPIFFRQIFDIENTGVDWIVSVVATDAVGSGETEFSGNDGATTSNFLSKWRFSIYEYYLCNSIEIRAYSFCHSL